MTWSDFVTCDKVRFTFDSDVLNRHIGGVFCPTADGICRSGPVFFGVQAHTELDLNGTEPERN